jgi:hypothetical protein
MYVTKKKKRIIIFLHSKSVQLLLQYVFKNIVHTHNCESNGAKLIEFKLNFF